VIPEFAQYEIQMFVVVVLLVMQWDLSRMKLQYLCWV
jgi:hypothetical protein